MITVDEIFDHIMSELNSVPKWSSINISTGIDYSINHNINWKYTGDKDVVVINFEGLKSDTTITIISSSYIVYSTDIIVQLYDGNSTIIKGDKLNDTHTIQSKIYNIYSHCYGTSGDIRIKELLIKLEDVYGKAMPDIVWGMF